MEDHTTTDSTLAILRELRADFPATGAVLQAYLHRTEADCRDLATRARGSGCARAPTRSRSRSPTRPRRGRPVLRALPEGPDGRARATRWSPPTTRGWSTIAGGARRPQRREPGQLRVPDAVRHPPDEQQRLADAGETVRVYVPYGDEWYGYLVRRLAERPANLRFFLARSRRRATMTMTACVAILGAGKWARPCCPACSGPDAAARLSSPSAARSGRPSCPSSTASRSSATPRRPSGRHPGAGRQAAGHGRAARRVGAAPAAGAGSSSRSPPASRRVHRGAPARGHPGRAGHDQHARRWSTRHGRDLAPASHATEAHLAEARSCSRPSGKVVRVPESQQDAVTALSRQRPGVLLLPRRGDDRRRHPARPAARSTATELIVQTALGAASMLRESGEHPVVLREPVTRPAAPRSPRSAQLEDHGVRAAFMLARSRRRATASDELASGVTGRG